MRRRLVRRCSRAPIAAALLAVGLLAFGCAPGRPTSSTTPGQASSANAPTTVGAAHTRRPAPQASGGAGQVAHIGAVLSLSGPAALLGMSQRNGLRLAQDEINASTLLAGTRLDIALEDDASDRDQASAVFQRFIESGNMLAIIGPTLSDTALAVDPIAQQAGIPVLAISNSASGITEIGNFIFRASLSETQLTPQVVRTVRSRLKIHSAALLYSDTDPNRTGSHGFKKALQDRGVQITSEQVFAADQTDFTPQLEAIVASHPDAVFVAASSHIAASVLIQARRTGLADCPIIGSNAFNANTVLRSAGDAAEGLIVGSAWSSANASPRNQQFIRSYQARYSTDPDQLAAQAYTGVYILATALKDAGTTSDTQAVRSALERVQNLDTPLGPFSFTPAHDADYAPTVQIVRGGHFELF